VRFAVREIGTGGRSRPQEAPMEQRKSIRANGTEIHYVEAGKGEPLVLLHGGMLSTNPIWAAFPGAYASRMDAFTEHFRVIAPDLRGHGKTVQPTGVPITIDQLADDALALIAGLELKRPLVCGFSHGATIATVLAIRKPDAVRALVNHAGYDLLNPNREAPAFRIFRQMFGGHPDATEADPVATERALIAQGMGEFLELVKADHDGSQGPGTWQKIIHGMFNTLQTWPGYSFDDFSKIAVPTLILTGDRDPFCPVEDAVLVFRKLAKGELAILPNEGHGFSDAAVRTTLAFLRGCAHDV
jgi:pimeloyl-ACP methyl ester carboxylesterase